MDYGVQVSKMATALLYMQMGISMKVIGKMAWEVVLAVFIGKMEGLLKETGLRENNMEKASL